MVSLEWRSVIWGGPLLLVLLHPPWALPSFFLVDSDTFSVRGVDSEGGFGWVIWFGSLIRN